MKIYLDSPINKYYVQTLGMIFFPGEHFGEEEEATENTPFLSVKTVEEENGIRAFAEIGCNGETQKAEYFAEALPERTAERTLKLAVGGAVLAAAGALTGYRPAWGMLIGVRPSKVASEMLNAGISKTRVKKLLTSDYLVIPKKAALATDIALTEKRIIGEPSPKDCSVTILVEMWRILYVLPPSLSPLPSITERNPPALWMCILWQLATSGRSILPRYAAISCGSMPPLPPVATKN